LLGDGDKDVKPGSMVSVRYKGMLLNGTVFDTNMPRGAPLKFRVGEHEVVKGFEQGVEGIPPGGRRVVVMPPHLAYGKRGAPPDIPPHSTLTFDIQLLKTQQ